MKVKIIGITTAIALMSLTYFVWISQPKKEIARTDFNRIFEQEVGKNFAPIILSLNAGEGDSDNVYMHVRFKVVSNADAEVKSSWFPKTIFRAGEVSEPIELIMLYQRQGSGWKLVKHGVVPMPN